MPTRVIPIDDPADPRLLMYRHLKATNETRYSGQFVVEGLTLFERLLTSRYPVASVVLSERAGPGVAERVPEGVPVYALSHATVETLVGYNFHRGVLACGYHTPGPTIDELVGQGGPASTFVVCPHIDNPENLGTILRIADVFGVRGVLTGPRCPDPLSRRVLRVSTGSALGVPVVAPPDLAAALEALRRDHGFRLTATSIDPLAVPLDRYDPPTRLALLMGSEGHGLDPAWELRCDDRLTIPMRPGAESLNVAVAAGIILYALTLPALRPRDGHSGAPQILKLTSEQ